ncbi:glucosamine-6-phosphate deaminase [Falsibacillus pallidus]|uniref:Glucosamine-6-phosphate deaminase n=1 Tax=Falsibacillus pallidus TaxID=493781 RepID=A0A370GDT0_9BACI|nr:glucosamine-6-phosphate deaminase [Falsibacillus pallidus]RDI41390.1 glucosamine-6-phosphate deaminase [Falsibacillus pallidus]
MNIIETANYEEMSRKAADYLVKLVSAKKDAVLGLATGSTPHGLYSEMVEDHKMNGTSYEQIRTVNLDEYIGLPSTDPNSYHTFMRKRLFDWIDIKSENTHIPNGQAGSLEKECLRYEQMIENLGGIDLQVLGIGHNGHIGFNEPGTSFNSSTHVVELAESTKKANSRFFASLDEVPTQAITMGIKTIMKSKEILLLVSGSSKAETLQKLIHGPFTEDFPASILQRHPNVTIIADQDALSLLRINK